MQRKRDFPHCQPRLTSKTRDGSMDKLKEEGGKRKFCSGSLSNTYERERLGGLDEEEIDLRLDLKRDIALLSAE